jgi:hypothetical protein
VSATVAILPATLVENRRQIPPPSSTWKLRQFVVAKQLSWHSTGLRKNSSMIRNVGNESPSSPQVRDGTGQTEGPGGQAVPMMVFVVLEDVLLLVSDLYRLS